MRFHIAFLLLLLWTPVANAFLPQNYRRNRPFLSRLSEKAVTVKRLPDSAVEIEIPVPGSATKAAYDKVCAELSKNIQIPGFRKGSRIPPQVLEQRMAARGGRNALKVQAINELIAQLVESALKSQSLEPIGQPSLATPAEELADGYKPGEDLVLPIRCDVWPEIKWKGEKPYIGLTGKYTRKQFNKEKMDRALNDLRERYAALEPISDSSYKLQMGDSCTVNMDGYMATPAGEKGEPLPNAASGDQVEVVLATGRYMEGLVEGLVGAGVGETRQVRVSFPDKLRDKSLAGKKAVFDVEVLSASKRIVPEVTDEFAAKVRAGLTKESLMAELRKAVDQEDVKEYAPARNKVLANALAQVMEVEVPDTLVTNQAREKFAVMMADMREGGVSDEEIKKQISPENFNKYKEIVKPDIVKDFKISLATSEIAQKEGITVPDYQIEEQMEAIRKDAAQNKEEFDEKMIRAKVEATMTQQAVYDWLAENSNLEVVFETEGAEDDDFDEALMQKLAEESLERDKAKIAAETGVIVDVPAVAAAVTTKAEVSEPTVETPSKEPDVASEPPVESAVTAKVDDSTKDEVEKEDSTPPTEKADEKSKAEAYANMSLQDRAFQILKDLGLAGSSDS
ncbi:hypothetical protein ACA910_019920 [Epithemia clementina (nom. ined.)]